MSSVKYKWQPDEHSVSSSNIFKTMKDLGISEYESFYNWSNENRKLFWEKTLQSLDIKFSQEPSEILDLSDGIENAHWLKGARMNIADSCFKTNTENTALIIQQGPNEKLERISYKALHELCCRVANGLDAMGLKKGDPVAIDMPMTLEAVAAYLGSIMAGLKLVTVADSFTPDEIKIRLDIAKVKHVFTIDSYMRSGKTIRLYEKVKKAGNYSCIVFRNTDSAISPSDISWTDFLSEKASFSSVQAQPENTMTILFSSGTTGNPKAIPWNHTTPVKSASDGYYHHDIHENDVVCWPTNLGWMMGPWLVFATLINKGTIALYYDSPLGEDFGKFIQDAKVNMLGVVPSLVKVWKDSACMEKFNWSHIKCYSSTGECSNPEDMSYLMDLAGNKPVIEYCGGTETGGGYISGTIVQAAVPGTFTSPALGGAFYILNEDNKPCSMGEVFLDPPIMGLSTKLLNRDHHEVYHKDCPVIKGKLLRRHGDQIEKLANGYFKAHGRVDDSMNLGGIKVSSTQIEETVSKLDFIKESAAVGIPPKGGGPDRLVLCIVLSRDIDKETALKETQREVKDKINPLFKVAECHFYESLPRTASNKVMRRKLRSDLISLQ